MIHIFVCIVLLLRSLTANLCNVKTRVISGLVIFPERVCFSNVSINCLWGQTDPGQTSARLSPFTAHALREGITLTCS